MKILTNLINKLKKNHKGFKSDTKFTKLFLGELYGSIFQFA